MEYFQRERTHFDSVAVFHMTTHARDRRAGVHDQRGRGQAVQIEPCCGMVGMRVGVDNAFQPQAFVCEQRKIKRDVASQGIDQNGLSAHFICDEIGFAFTAVEFAKNHVFIRP